jgi:hypothetical protein
MGNNVCRNPLTKDAPSERRSGVDRRNPSGFFSIFTAPFRRRESKGRRKTDRGAYVDIYDRRSWAIAIAVLIMSAFDALLTGIHIVRGSASEANPIMSAVIDHAGLPVFFGVKAAMTFFPVAIILIHKEWALGKVAARVCLWVYIFLSLYHIYLICAGQGIRS